VSAARRRAGLLLALSLLAGCGRQAPPPERRELSAAVGGPAPVVLIVLDALRADHTSLPGARSDGLRRDTTPFLRELASQGIVFENAFTTASWSRPAMASLLTGRLPASHGCDAADSRLSDLVARLPELLAAQGYDTRAVVASPHLAPEQGFLRGWSGYHWRASRPLTPYSDAQRMREAVRETLAEMAPPPFLLLVQLMDCQPPWGPHPETDFDPLYGGTFDGDSDALGPFLDRPPSAANLRRARDLYDGAARWLDDQLRDLFRELQARGALDGAWVVVTASHGLQLWERGALGHRGSLSQEVLHVPLVIRPPGGISPPRVVAERFSLIDLAPTLVELLGLPGSVDFDGTSWAPFLLGRGAAPERPVIACELGRDGDERAALLQGPHKLLANLGSGDLLLYDLQSDPHEQQPLELPAGTALPPAVERLRVELLRALDSARARRPAPAWAAGSLPPDVRRQLQALGALEGDG